MNTKYFLIRLKFVLLSMIAKVGGNSDSTAFRVRSRNLGFSLSYYHQNLSTNKVKNQREKSRWIFKQFSKDSGLCHASCGRHSKKCFAQIYKVMYGDAKFVSLRGAQIWRPEGKKNVFQRVCYKKPVVVFWGLINIYMTTYFHTRTVQIAKSQRISHFFEPTLQHSGRHFSKRFNFAFSQEQKPYQIEMLEKT